MKLNLGPLITMSTFLGLTLCGHVAGAYEADNASTPTLWALPQTQRVAADTARRGTYYGNRINDFLEENKTAVKGGTVFLGDSLTNQFPIAKAFAGKNVYNRGIGGDRIEGILERLDCSVITLEPTLIFVMIGANDVLWPVDYRNGNLAPGYERLFASLKAVAPQATVIAFTMPPIDKHQDRLGTCIADNLVGNAQLKTVCTNRGIELRDTFSALVNAEGNYRKGMSTDGVHLSLDGYLVWLEFIVQTTDEKYAVWKNLAADYAPLAAETWDITGINAYRWNHTLILFRNEAGARPTTNANQWGYEVQVVDGKVTLMSAAGNMAVPAWPGGYVLSGIDETHTWLQTKAHIGANVTLSPDLKKVTIKPAVAEAISYESVRRSLIVKMSKDATPDDEAKSKAIVAKINPQMTTQEMVNAQNEIDGLASRVEFEK